MIPASKNLRYLRARSQVRGWEKAKRMVYTIKNYGPAKIPSICANIVDFNQVQTLTKPNSIQFELKMYNVNLKILLQLN